VCVWYYSCFTCNVLISTTINDGLVSTHRPTDNMPAVTVPSKRYHSAVRHLVRTYGVAIALVDYESYAMYASVAVCALDLCRKYPRLSDADAANAVMEAIKIVKNGVVPSPDREQAFRLQLDAVNAVHRAAQSKWFLKFCPCIAKVVDEPAAAAAEEEEEEDTLSSSVMTV
jgi:hypothetical protein